MRFVTQRVYEPPAQGDGCRVLIDRLWPRGLAKADAAVDHWAKDLAPSTELRQWFGHEPERYEAFVERYRAELDEHPEVAAALLDTLREMGATTVTLVYAARDDRPHHAPVVRAYLAGARPTRGSGWAFRA